MLFNSYNFIFVFLPITAALYFAAERLGAKSQVYVLAAASIAFYCVWDIRYLVLLLISICFNFCVGWSLVRSRSSSRSMKRLLALGIFGNLAVLGYYKYANFFIDTANELGASIPELNVILPLGISFFTFTQLAFLVDAYRGKTDEPKFIEYLTFVTYFPHLIAGPIIHHHETIPQFRRRHAPRSHWLAPGLALFSIGFAKKVLIADPFGMVAKPIFDAFAKGGALQGLDAWIGALCFTFQLYFDFSAYSDMAIGISLMLGIYIPLNFDSPYKATSIIDFWRRWHMTLSRYLRDYLYIPLGGNRQGSARRFLNLFLTMLTGGLWHGAGWTFVVWGGLHGAYLAINHAWRHVGIKSFAWPSRILTFLCVVVAWVFFKAADLPTALHMIQKMFTSPSKISAAIDVKIIETMLPMPFRDAGIPVSGLQIAYVMLAAGFLIAWFFPNSQELVFRRKSPWKAASLDQAAEPEMLTWSWWLAPVTATLAMCSLAALISAPPGEFLYFMF